jgi:2-methylcitrate dehydratase PrpD
MDTPAVSDLISAHVSASHYQQVPAEAIDAAKRSLLDAIGVMLAASALGEGCAAFADLALQGAGAGECTLLGYGIKAALLPAVLANGALAHALDFEDALDAAPCHPNAALVPVALALAQARAPICGRTLLTAVAVGCDLVCRLALALREDPGRFGWYTPPILGAFGAAATAARLLNLTPLATRDALSLTLCQSTCSAELKSSRRSLVRAVRDGFSAQAGLLSALLAQRGVAGFEQPFEGRAGLYALYARGAWDARTLIERLGSHFHGAQVSFKPWPSCRGTHALIEAALELRRQHHWSVADIDSVRARGGPIQRMLAEPRAQKLQPQTAIDAKFSIPFTVATALIHGEVTLERFTSAALSDERVLSLARRVSFEIDPAVDSAEGTAGELQITLHDRQCFAMRIVHPRGHGSKPLSWEDLVAKFNMCATHAVRPPSPAQSARLIAAVRNLEAIDDVGSALFPDRDGEI